MLDFVPVVLKNVFSRPATRDYPKQVRKPYDKQKGHIVNDIDNCIFCGLCGRKCPVNALTVARDKGTWTIDRFKCIVCGACVEGCPKKCLDIAGEYTPAAYKKSVDTVVGKPPVKKTVVPPVKKPVAAQDKPQLKAVGTASANTENMQKVSVGEQKNA